MAVKLPRTDRMDAMIDDAELDTLPYKHRTGRYRLRLSRDDLATKSEVLGRLFRLAYDSWTDSCVSGPLGQGPEPGKTIELPQWEWPPHRSRNHGYSRVGHWPIALSGRWKILITDRLRDMEMGQV